MNLVETRDFDEVQRVNALFEKDFFKLTDRELELGHWWIGYLEMAPPSPIIGFCGYVPFDPFAGYVYLKRAAILPLYRGQGYQGRMIDVREAHAHMRLKTHAITETEVVNTASGNNMIRAGYKMFLPMRPWQADKEYNYWIKELK